MAKYIDADTVVSMPFLDDSYGIEKHTVETDTIENLLDRFTKEGCPEPADVAPVVHGEYIGEYDGYADGNPVCDMWYCSVCGCCFEDWDEKPTYNFCPNCGAKMEEDNG